MDEHEKLYGAFVEEAVPLFIDAVQQPAVDSRKVMRFFSIMGRIRLICSDEVLRAAEDVGKRLVEAYERPPQDPAKVLEQLFTKKETLDPLLEFTVACRRERSKALNKV
jgi:hypothetical protein